MQYSRSPVTYPNRPVQIPGRFTVMRWGEYTYMSAAAYQARAWGYDHDLWFAAAFDTPREAYNAGWERAKWSGHWSTKKEFYAQHTVVEDLDGHAVRPVPRTYLQDPVKRAERIKPVVILAAHGASTDWYGNPKGKISLIRYFGPHSNSARWRIQFKQGPSHSHLTKGEALRCFVALTTSSSIGWERCPRSLKPCFGCEVAYYKTQGKSWKETSYAKARARGPVFPLAQPGGRP